MVLRSRPCGNANRWAALALKRKVLKMDEQDFGNDYLEFYPAVNGLNQYGNPGTSQVCIDGWFTSAQLRNIAAELDRLEGRLPPGGVD